MSKKFILALMGWMLLMAPTMQAQQYMEPLTPRENIDMGWWKESKFGLFLVWGLYSAMGCQWNGKDYNEFVQLWNKIPVSEMEKIATTFNPTGFNAEEWVLYAKNTGMKYIVITAKHHEGFVLYDSPCSTYDIVDATPFKRDPFKELSDACEKHGIRFCVYYSLGRDWADPDVPSNWPRKGGRSNDWDWPDEDAKDFSKYFERKVKPQMIELLTQYKVDMVWFDTHGFCTPAQSEELMELIEHYRPGCLVNDRVGNGFGDFFTPEQTVINDISRDPWESCITASRVWGYAKADSIYKSSEVLVRLLVDVTSKGGNLLLNIPPNDKGIFLPQGIDRMKAIGRWMQTNGEAIYGTEPWHVFGETFVPVKTVASGTDQQNPDATKDETAKGTEADIRFTSKGNTLYVFARSWQNDQVEVKDLMLTSEQKIKKITLLGSKSTIRYEQQGHGIKMSLPKEYRPEIPVYVYKLELE